MLRVFVGERDWHVSVLDQPLPGKGQDAWAVGATSACLVDGATPLAEDWPQDVAEFAQAAALTMVRQSDVPAYDISQAWANTIRQLNGRFAPAGFKRTAGAAVVRSAGGAVTFSGLGDVMCLVQTVDGPVSILDPTLPALDRAAAEQGVTTQALMVNRRRANQPDGYPVVGDDPAAGERAVTRVFAADSLLRFWLLTDGIWRTLPEEPEEAVALLTRPKGDWWPGMLNDVDDDATILAFTPDD